MTEPDDRYPGFHAFVAARSVALVRTAYLLTGNQHAAEDLVQEALSRVVVRWRSIVAKGDPEPYVRRVLYTVHVSRWWHVRAQPVVQPPRAGLDEAEGATWRVALGQALDRLTPKQRAVLVLRYYEDLPAAQKARPRGRGGPRLDHVHADRSRVDRLARPLAGSTRSPA